MESIEELAQRWLSLDQDSTTRNEIETLLREKNEAELEKRLRKRIAFGTAGLRGPMKAGFACMNSLTVLQASHGLANYILKTRKTPSRGAAKKPSVVIEHDSRHNSIKFANLAIAAFLEKGFAIYGSFTPVHTPVVPWSVRQYEADAGVMITASHNPKDDNGYKVYWNNGCQIIPPHDAGIAAEIEKVGSIDSWVCPDLDDHEDVHDMCETNNQYYSERIRSLVSFLSSSSSAEPEQILPCVYTPLHGVGSWAIEFMLGRSYSEALQPVPTQAKPDPDFPTIPFPNPEEKGALDLAKQEANKLGLKLILANDPDADRFAAAELLENGDWHQFTGNQMGIMLASFMFEMHQGPRDKLAMLTTTVSSRMLAAMAKKEGFHFQETLTGFKWLGNIAQDLNRAGYQPIYAFEEAIGYMFPIVCWDKDGVAAAAVFLKACGHWKKQGLTPYTKLQALYQKYGYFEDANTYLISPSPETTNKVFNDVRRLNKGSRPETVGSRTISRWRDLTTGYDTATPDNEPELPIDASAQMITCELGDVVFTARGSGTEPKIKLYIEAQAKTSEEAKGMADEVLRDLLREWFRAEYGLKLAGT
ncbi:uncharacterized protein LTR77_006054 [Saxophila tyrrhenica]|uniref:Phosphoglucomutase n=1 Tax=Saxophila tyrrhenica TaxID=1690608 RepID=A0AAV9PB33_9PEZI|nr:hypothetical protein LTR77_006054 [Saxophila tyrrhenica]